MRKISKIVESKKKYNIKKIDFQGYEILYGKDAASNDYLTTEIADPEDLWFHVTDGIQGSHVIIKGLNPPKNVIDEATKIAKLNSKGKDLEKIRIVYCLKKYVSKTPEMNAGQVKVDHSNSKFIEL